MSNGVAVLGALGSALCFATSSVLQQRGAARAPRGSGLHLDLILHLVRRPVWLAGMCAALGTLALQAVALSSGQLALVQPLLVAGLLFALPLSVLLERRRPSGQEWLWAAVLVAGLATFLGSAAPRSGPELPDDGRLWQFGLLVLTGVVIIAVLGSWFGGRHRAVLLGVATGLAYGVAAALIKYCCALAGREGLGWLVASWPFYALIVVGAGGILLNQAAYQAGPLCGALPAIAIFDPLIAVVFGVATFGEHLHMGLLPVAGQVTGFAVMAVAIIRLAGQAAGRHPTEVRCAATARDERGLSIPSQRMPAGSESVESESVASESVASGLAADDLLRTAA
jgi:drug/metabolite transporter (DMT)-like permease